ncbi:MAG: acyl-CoA dehydratase activase [Thermodesulfovibrionales bacterium]
MIFIGLDAGSVSVKAVVLDGRGNRLYSTYVRHQGNPLGVTLQVLSDILKSHDGGTDCFLSLAGSASKLLGEILGMEPVNEVVAHAYATRRLYPQVRTIIELGGEDSKLIILGEDSNTAQDFSMNSVCAAGTGSFLDQQAERLRLTIEEFGEASLKSAKPPRIAGRCSVFAKSDMIHLQQIATPVHDIAAGLCFAVARNFRGSIVRGREVPVPISFQGGVAANKGVARAFQEVFGVKELFIPPEFAFMGAIGAALKDRDAGKVKRFDLGRLGAYLSSVRAIEAGYRPLVADADGFKKRHMDKDLHRVSPPGPGGVNAFLGVDIGSISTNLAVVDTEGNLLGKRYLMTAGRPIEAVRQGLAEIGRELGSRVQIIGVGTTGSGRYMIADYIGADIVKNEITAQATAAAFIDPDVDTIFEIGGQDSKYISLKDGVIVDFEMNKACAAGTGSFLEEQAEKLAISVKTEFQEKAFSGRNPCRLGERCTVFMENSLMANLQKGTPREDLLAGLAYSIVQNYINRVVCKRPIGRKIFFQGGVAFNKAVVAAFERYLEREIIVPPHHDVTGAIGMALIARDHYAANPARPTQFKGFELSQRSYEISSFSCGACPNVCEINQVKVEGEEGSLLYGGRCEKYDVRRRKTEQAVPDLFSLRDELLRKEYGGVSSGKSLSRRASPAPPTIGIPGIFTFHDFMPYWTTLLRHLGLEPVVSPKTDRSVIDAGSETVLSETCFPVKTALGHIKHLLDAGVGHVLVPSFVNLNPPDTAFVTGFACPYTQTIPYLARTAFPGSSILAPVIDRARGQRYLARELRRVLRPFGISQADIGRAMAAAEQAQEEFAAAIREEGRKVLASLDRRAIVIIGRAYNSFDRGMNLDIPRKLANLGVLAIPMDFLPIEDIDVSSAWPNMYWRAGQRILAAARFVRKSSLLHAIYIGNFSCGPDSFIIKFFEEEMADKPYLHLELDAHSADAGAVTRCEAFLDSIGNAAKSSARIPAPSLLSGSAEFVIAGRSGHAKTVYIPRMSDHAFALSAAFRACGVPAEVLPEPTRESVDLGRRFVSGKECYPCAVTTGDMVAKTMQPDFDASRSAFFMPSGTGPCRFGQYNVFHRMVISELGLENVPVFSPNQNERFYKELGLVGRDFVLCSWKGIVAIELLKKCLHETRPYELKRGASDELYAHYLDCVQKALASGNGSLDRLLRDARADFGSIPRRSEERPLIGIIGEIFVRSNRFSNEDLVRKIEELGAEACLAPVEEWLYYINLMGLRRTLIKKDWSGMISLLVTRFVKKRIEHGYSRHFRGFLKTLHEPDTRSLLRKAEPYLHPSFEGEAVLSIGKSIDLIGKGAAGIVNAMPFGCMPGTIVTGLLRGVKRDHDIPCLSIPYDGTESLTATIQLEAFMDQAREFHGRLNRSGSRRTGHTGEQ